MPQPALKFEVAAEAVRRVEAKLREGFRPSGMSGTGPGALAAAADEWRISKGTLQGRLAAAATLYGLAPDESAYRPRVYLHRPPGLPVMAYQDHVTEPMPEGRSRARQPIFGPTLVHGKATNWTADHL
jgi:hypothetical protein